MEIEVEREEGNEVATADQFILMWRDIEGWFDFDGTAQEGEIGEDVGAEPARKAEAEAGGGDGGISDLHVDDDTVVSGPLSRLLAQPGHRHGGRRLE